MAIIPPKSKKVFSGIIFDIYQRSQQMFDGTTKTFEMARKNHTASVIPITKDGKIVITQQKQPNSLVEYFCFPGGRLDCGENATNGAKRELKEETGLKPGNFFSYKVYEPFYKIDYKFHLFIAQSCEYVCKQELDGGEKIKILEINFDKMIDIVTDDSFGNYWFANDIFKMKNKGKLGEFKKLLGCK